MFCQWEGWCWPIRGPSIDSLFPSSFSYHVTVLMFVVGEELWPGRPVCISPGELTNLRKIKLQIYCPKEWQIWFTIVTLGTSLPPPLASCLPHPADIDAHHVNKQHQDQFADKWLSPDYIHGADMTTFPSLVTPYTPPWLLTCYFVCVYQRLSPLTPFLPTLLVTMSLTKQKYMQTGQRKVKEIWHQCDNSVTINSPLRCCCFCPSESRMKNDPSPAKPCAESQQNWVRQSQETLL